MLITEGNLDIWYNDYKKQFEKTKKFVKSRGGDVSDIAPLSRRSFARDFKMIASENPQAGGKGVSTKLAKEQFTARSKKQVEKLSEAYRKVTGMKTSPSIEAAFKYETKLARDFYKFLQAKRQEFEGTEKTIGHEFFGSK